MVRWFNIIQIRQRRNKVKTEKLTKKEMANLIAEYIPAFKDRDAIWTLINRLKHRSDLAYLLMVISTYYSGNQYQAELWKEK